MTDLATVSNLYSALQGADEPVVDHCTAAGIPDLPFFALAVGEVADPGARAIPVTWRGTSPPVH